ncbi:hypothetical protein VNI00_005230 [Paramarasmius palmivorus]|uniref:Uncharacterized protein n=1 Tax=Paramarasmius palmivorus TaxID=297713 RepID=A0AAW0DBH8_9AGAR
MTRAYIRIAPPTDGVNDVSLDTSRPASAEDLSAIGWKISTLDTDLQGQEQFKALAKSQGFPQPEGVRLDLGLVDDVEPFMELANKVMFKKYVSFGVPFTA